MPLRRPTPRWTTLIPHAAQIAYYNSQARFNTLPAGRRSGKTELGKRKVVRKAIARVLQTNPRWHNGRFGVCAPTRDQAKSIYWDDLKALVPKRYLATAPRETDLTIILKNNVEIRVVGMDKPERIEGTPWDFLLLDEYGNMKAHAWDNHVRPALADRRGGCDMIGVPEGRNHYYDLHKKAMADTTGEWLTHHWISADILPPEEVESARRSMDELTFKQEFEAAFVNFAGQAYYPFSDQVHCRRLVYNPKLPLIFCFDFNVEPGVAAVVQEQVIPGSFELIPDPSRYGHGVQGFANALKAGPGAFIRVPAYGTGVIGEVHIPHNSNTPAVCNRLIADWGNHQGAILCYGDATGGARGTAQTEGSDWDLITRLLMMHYGNRVTLMVPSSNPPERSRVNAVNTRLKTMDGVVRLAVDPGQAPNVVRDFEGVRTLEGGSGEIDKKRDKKLSHVTDALGYYIVAEFPVMEPEIGTGIIGGRF